MAQWLVAGILLAGRAEAADPARLCDGGELRGCKDACAEGVVRACIKLGDRSDASDERLVAYSQACDLGSALGCRAVGDLYNTGVFGSVDGSSAGEWYLRACELGDAGACTAAALWVERGDGRATQTPLELLQRACEAHDPRGCSLLGERWLRGASGAKKDPTEAWRWFSLGCAPPAPDPYACRELGVAELEGRGVAADEAAGVEHLHGACDKADRLACLALARHHADGKRWADAASFAARSCDLGEDAGCRLQRKSAGHGSE